jgi:SpoVK/Ycf46/Vps4 family AAA+-type ATPase
MALDKYTELHFDYIDTMSDFYDIYPEYSPELSKLFEKSIPVSALHLWRYTGASAEECTRAIDELYFERKYIDTRGVENIRPVYEKIKEQDIPLKVPKVFFDTVLEYDKKHKTAYFLVLADCYLEFLRAVTIFHIDGTRNMFRTLVLHGECNKCYRHMVEEWEKCGIYAEKPKRNTTKYASGMDELNSMIGMENVKKEFQQMENFAWLQMRRRDENLPAPPVSYHLVFTGNPGTGKTTTARIAARIYKELGLLSKGHLVEVGSQDLVSCYMGHTAIKTQKILESAKGGVLFIDEAYTLAEGHGYGNEAIDTILKFMEDNRDDFIVIAAGYEELMEKFISSNPGLRSRFNRFILFEDYSPEEMYRIFKSQCASDMYKMYYEAKNEVIEYFIDAYKHRDETFANGRTVRNYYEQIRIRQAERLRKNNSANLNVFSLDDVKWERREEEISLEDAMNELNALTGLTAVKKELSELVNFVRLQQIRKEKGLPVISVSLHLVFTGNPGTGKTTVARCIAKIYNAMGLLSKGHLVETDRSDLVAGYIGQSALKTQKVIKKAMGGVLFIDEAYSLNNESEKDFGHEVIDTILKAMEDHRDNLVVIVAGYDNEMEKFLQSNPGLKSRFNHFIHFDDYSVDELTGIFESMCRDQQLSISDGARKKLKDIFSHIDKTTFGNGRGVRNLYEKTLIRQASRLMSDADPDITIVTEEDIPV